MHLVGEQVVAFGGHADGAEGELDRGTRETWPRAGAAGLFPNQVRRCASARRVSMLSPPSTCSPRLTS
jgi:hypothetical protein